MGVDILMEEGAEEREEREWRVFLIGALAFFSVQREREGQREHISAAQYASTLLQPSKTPSMDK